MFLIKTNLSNKSPYFLKILLLFLFCAVGFPGLAGAFNSSDKDLAVGDAAQLLIPAFGLSMSLYRDDTEGTQQWLKSTGSTMLATQVLKFSFANTEWGTRPNGASKSFPSGHTSSACSGAAFLATRYGWEYGTPAFVMAAYVGYSRVDEDMHHWRDVIAGCALGVFFNYTFVTPENAESTINMSITDQGVPVIDYRFRF